MPVSGAQLQQAIDSFVSDIESLIKQATLQTVEAALGGIAVPSGARAARKVPAAPLTRPGKPTSEPKRAKRSPEEVEAFKVKLQKYVAKHPGQRMEQIGKALGEPTKELQLPMRKLIVEGKVAMKGTRRAATYSAS